MLAALIAGGYMAYQHRDWLASVTSYNAEQELTQEEKEAMAAELEAQAKAKWKEEVKNSADFQAEIDLELERRYQQQKLQEAQQELDKLDAADTTSFNYTARKTAAVRKYLQAQGSPLANYAADLVELPRWQEVIAIAGHETGYCTAGVGASRNNCGAIRGDSGFRYYDTPMDAMQDLAGLLQRRYNGMSIAQMNGRYCVYEEGPTGTGPCPGWTETITRKVDAIKVAVYNAS